MALESFDVSYARSQFLALTRNTAGKTPIFFDGPGGTQVCSQSILAATDYCENRCANGGGTFETSRLTDETTLEGRRAMADLLNAPEPETIVFGANMTTLTFHLSHAIADTIVPGDEVVVTNLDHDANVAPWLRLQNRGATIRVVDIDPSDCTLDPDCFDEILNERTRIVAITHGSNAVGTVPNVAEITRRSHTAGALVFVDAVQYVPHAEVDVQELNCDFLACSAYKFFGPHVGVLYGKREHLERFSPPKVRPAHDEIPFRWETGTPNYEGIAGVHGAVRYFEDLGASENKGMSGTDRPAILRSAMRSIHDYEMKLAERLLDGLESIRGVEIYGITDRTRMGSRGATVAFNIEGWRPRDVASALAERDIYCWSGNYYAIRLMERLGLEPDGAVRVGLVHYNTIEEIEVLVSALSQLKH